MRDRPERETLVKRVLFTSPAELPRTIAIVWENWIYSYVAPGHTVPQIPTPPLIHVSFPGLPLIYFLKKGNHFPHSLPYGANVKNEVMNNNVELFSPIVIIF